MTATTAVAPATNTGSAAFRPDIEGLRMVAVMLVLTYHAGIPHMSGGFAGVDVFFVISGFLITSGLLREIAKNQTISLPKFYARRARRLLPAAAVTLLATLALTLLYLPRIYWRETGWDILSAAAYFINWRLAGNSIDYLANERPSIVQHFWSLAVEEQFYFIWPVLLLLVVLATKKASDKVRTIAIATTLSIVVASSLAYSITYTATNPAEAYFVTTTRLWELGIGALVAVAVPWLSRLPIAVSTILSWGGIAAIVYGALAQSTALAWPGSAALIPVLGSAAFIAGGITQPKFGAGIILGGSSVAGPKPLQWWNAAARFVGALSYSLYLVHWPIMVAFASVWGPMTIPEGIRMIVLSLMAAIFLHFGVENPLRFSNWLAVLKRAFAMAAASTATLALCGFALSTSNVPTLPLGKAINVNNVTGHGASPLMAHPLEAERNGRFILAKPNPDDIPASWPDPTSIYPSVESASTEDVPDIYKQHCEVGQYDEGVKSCVYGQPKGKTTVAVVGDSKISQWLTALDAIGKDRKWKIVVYTKSACAWNSADPVDLNGKQNPSCAAWNDEVTKLLTDPRTKPNLILTSGLRSVAMNDEGKATNEAQVAGYIDAWSKARSAGVPVVVLADTPRPGRDLMLCVAEHPDRVASKCGYRYSDGHGTPTLNSAVMKSEGTTLVNVNRFICPVDDKEFCPAIMNGVLVYRSGFHLTDSFVKTMTPVLQQYLQPVLDTELARQAASTPKP